jgi:hypothetical protein
MYIRNKNYLSKVRVLHGTVFLVGLALLVIDFRGLSLRGLSFFGFSLRGLSFCALSAGFRGLCLFLSKTVSDFSFELCFDAI